MLRSCRITINKDRLSATPLLHISLDCLCHISRLSFLLIHHLLEVDSLCLRIPFHTHHCGLVIRISPVHTIAEGLSCWLPFALRHCSPLVDLSFLVAHRNTEEDIAVLVKILLLHLVCLGDECRIEVVAIIKVGRVYVLHITHDSVVRYIHTRINEESAIKPMMLVPRWIPYQPNLIVYLSSTD